jgi:hypothetical protein
MPFATSRLPKEEGRGSSPSLFGRETSRAEGGPTPRREFKGENRWEVKIVGRIINLKEGRKVAQCLGCGAVIREAERERVDADPRYARIIVNVLDWLFEVLGWSETQPVSVFGDYTLPVLTGEGDVPDRFADKDGVLWLCQRCLDRAEPLYGPEGTHTLEMWGRAVEALTRAAEGRPQ